MKRFALTLAAILCGVWLALAPPSAAGKDTWISVRSRNFLLIGNASEGEIRQVGIRLEQFREVFSRLFPNSKINTPVPTTVVVFKSDNAYRPFKPNANTAGYFQPGSDVNYITLTTETRGEQASFNVIFHEYTHLLVNNTMGAVPVWLNEGLAEFYSTFSISNDRKVMLGKFIPSHVLRLRETRLLPLHTLFQVDQKSPYYNEGNKQSIFYAESWALIHYLILGNNGQRVMMLDKFIKAVDRNVPLEQAFQEAFATSFEKMEKELADYIQRNSYPYVLETLNSKLDFDKQMEAAPLGEAEVQAYLGDLLRHSNRADCESYLQKALALDPNQPLANAALAMVRANQGKFTEARQRLEHVVTDNDQNFLLHYYYAFVLSREGMDAANFVHEFTPEAESKMRGELNKAIALRPDFPESYSLLVIVNLVTGNQLDESIDLLKRVLATSPGRTDLVYMLAQVYARKADFKTARLLLQRILQSQNNGQIGLQAEAMLSQLKVTEENYQRYQAQLKDEASREANSSDSIADARRSEPDARLDRDPSYALRQVLRKPAAGELQVQGLLVRIDCDQKEIVFTIKVDDKVIRLRSERLEAVKFTTFSRDALGEISCGPFKPESSVVVCYLPGDGKRAGFDGTPTSIEFVPKEFKLKAASEY